MRALAVTMLALMLAACTTSRPVAVPPSIGALPIELTLPCKRPGELPARELSQREAEALWGSDRQNLATCASRHRAHVGAVAERDALLMGKQ